MICHKGLEMTIFDHIGLVFFLFLPAEEFRQDDFWVVGIFFDFAIIILSFIREGILWF